MDSDSDSDYDPGKTEENPEIKPEKKDLNKAKALLNEINKASEPSLPVSQNNTLEEALKIAKALKEKNSLKTEIQVKFAGEVSDVTLGKRSHKDLDQLISDSKKKKSINSLTKSTLD